MKREEIDGDYETNTGMTIVERFKGLDPRAVPAVLAANHGPFTWGADPDEAVRNSVVLEETARIALATKQLNPGVGRIDQALLDRHFQRKHGQHSYYGQQGENHR